MIAKPIYLFPIDYKSHFITHLIWIYMQKFFWILTSSLVMRLYVSELILHYFICKKLWLLYQIS
jgi:hypothetical protein